MACNIENGMSLMGSLIVKDRALHLTPSQPTFLSVSAS